MTRYGLMLGDGRVPHTPMEMAQARTEQMYEDQDNRQPLEHDPEADQRAKLYIWRGDKQREWTGMIANAIDLHGVWFAERACWNFSWRGETEWYFYLAKSAEPTIMDVPDPDGDTCFVTERIDPIEHKIDGTDPDAVGQAAIEFIGQIKLPVQNVPMPMDREVHDGIHGSQYLSCFCNLSYGIALRDFIRFSEHGPWIPRRKEVQLLGYPMSQ